MIRALWSSASGMQAQQMNIDVISNNLANVNTTGFKRSMTNFADLMYETERTPGRTLGDGTNTAVGLQVGYGAKPVSTSRSFLQGDLTATGNKTDIAIQGKGFFRVQLPNGDFAYTRDGSFKLNSQGQLVTNEGYRLSGVDQIDPKATELTIGNDGTMSIVLNGAVQQLSPVTMTDFANAEGLRAIGNNLYQVTEASGAAEDGVAPGAQGLGTLAQGYLEASNVRVVEEMVRMIQAQRAYEINSKAIMTSDEMMGIANNLRR